MPNFRQLGLLLLICGAHAQSSASCPSNVNATVTISSQADATSLAACPEISSSILISSEFQGQLSLDGPTSIDGDVICESAGSIVSIESSSLYWINGELTLSNLTNLSSVVLPQLNSTGGINMSTLPVLNLFGVANVLDGGGSNISISSTSLTSVPVLNHYDRVSIYNNTQLRDITISSSQLGHLDVHSNGPALSLNLPNLKFTNHDLLIANCSSINMPVVTTIGLLGGGLAISGYKFLSLSLTSISEIRGSATIVDNEGMISISLPALSQIDDTLDISSNNELIALALPGLKNVTDIYVSDNNLLQAISFPSLTWFDNADMSGNFSSVTWPNMGQHSVPGSINIATTNTLQGGCSGLNLTTQNNASASFSCNAKAKNTGSSLNVKGLFSSLIPMCLLVVVATLSLL